VGQLPVLRGTGPGDHLHVAVSLLQQHRDQLRFGDEPGHADGEGNSFSVTDLVSAGWAPGGTVTVDGARFTLPAFGSGQQDNVLARKQQVAYSYQVPTAGSSALMFLATSSHSSFDAPAGGDPLAAAPFTAPGTAVSGQYCFTGTTPDGYCPANGVIT
jgi:hypothetical protein